MDYLTLFNKGYEIVENHETITSYECHLETIPETYLKEAVNLSEVMEHQNASQVFIGTELNRQRITYELYRDDLKIHGGLTLEELELVIERL
ncbi:hypothetical protein V760_02588 [Staphylococcus aureus F23613]|uniref:hypothetical protein n=1 Tax=Staphylococcus aureus TaxID=1280 RepID=UPI00044CD39D|nr:hypothetical protein [Staphylococcus aureus]EXQ67344.1 hypothetical protein V760_02588 [Staphylococcus aureus F23613]